MAGFNLAVSRHSAPKQAGSAGTWLMVVVFAFLPVGFVTGPMVMQILGLWPY